MKEFNDDCTDVIRLSRQWIITKYASDEDFENDLPYEVVKFNGNVMLNEGITEALKLIGGITATAFSNANAFLGVGDNATAAAATQTGLQATTNKLYKAMQAGYPSVTSQSITWRAIFASGDANFAWQEFSVSNTSSDAGVNLNRKVSSQGTKTSGQSWTLDLVITMA